MSLPNLGTTHTSKYVISQFQNQSEPQGGADHEINLEASKRVLVNQWVTSRWLRPPLPTVNGAASSAFACPLSSAASIFTYCANDTEIAVLRGKTITPIFNKHIRQEGGWGKTTRARLGLLCMPFLNHHWISHINPIRRLVFTERTCDLPPDFLRFGVCDFNFLPVLSAV